MLGNKTTAVPCILDYTITAENGSMFNTPPTYAWYLAGLVFEWLQSIGGVKAISLVNQAKAQLLYHYIDSTDFYVNNVAKSQ